MIKKTNDEFLRKKRPQHVKFYLALALTKELTQSNAIPIESRLHIRTHFGILDNQPVNRAYNRHQSINTTESSYAPGEQHNIFHRGFWFWDSCAVVVDEHDDECARMAGYMTVNLIAAAPTRYTSSSTDTCRLKMPFESKSNRTTAVIPNTRHYPTSAIATASAALNMIYGNVFPLQLPKNSKSIHSWPNKRSALK